MSDPHVWQAHRAADNLSNTLASFYEEALATGLTVSADDQRLLARLGVVTTPPAEPPQQPAAAGPDAGPPSDGRPVPAPYADAALAPIVAGGRLTGRFRDGGSQWFAKDPCVQALGPVRGPVRLARL